MFENYVFRRVAAKGIDLLAGFALASFLSEFAGFLGLLVGMAFLIFCDFIGQGDGFGKRFFHLRVIDHDRRRPTRHIDFKQAALRNFPFAILLAFSSVTMLGGLLGFLFGLPFCLFEIYLFFSVTTRQRLGDVLAGTTVIETNSG